VIAREPRDGSDIAPLQPYVAALNDPNLPLASMRWTGGSSATVDADLRDGDLVSVQVTYEPGWHALVDGTERPVQRDALGMLVVHPQCEARCTIKLFYNDGREMRIATVLGFLSLATCLLLLLGPAWSRIRTAYK
jgi:hypothetical protein